MTDTVPPVLSDVLEVDEIDTIATRVTDDGSVEISYDGGVTWQPLDDVDADHDAAEPGT